MYAATLLFMEGWLYMFRRTMLRVLIRSELLALADSRISCNFVDQYHLDLL